MYITAQELENAFSQRALIELSNDSSRPTEVNAEVIRLAITHATETIDGYLRSRYVLPLATVPTIVRNIALQLARYWLYARRPEGKGLPETVKETHKQALKDLEAIASGKFHLGLAGVEPDDLLPEPLKFQTRANRKMDLSGY